MFFSKFATFACLGLSAFAAPIVNNVAGKATSDVTGVTGVVSNVAASTGVMGVLVTLQTTIAPKLEEIKAIAQDPTSALDAAKPAMAMVVDALNTATGALHNLQVVPAGVIRRDTTDDVAHLTATILDNVFTTLSIAHGPEETIQSLMPNVGVALAGVLTGLNAVVPGVLAIVSGLLGSVTSLIAGLSLDGVLGGLLN